MTTRFLLPLAIAAAAVPPPAAAAEQADAHLLYVAPHPDAPLRRVGGASRGAADTLRVAVLAPEQLGLTALGQPDLYWFSSAPTSYKIELTVIDRKSVAPLLRRVLDGSGPAGIHRFSLRGTPLVLAPDTDYEWSIAVVPNPAERSSDILSSGAIQRVRSDAALAGKLGGDPEANTAALASAGLWYDALATLSGAIEAEPGNKELLGQRADLFDQVGLKDAAAFDRR
jgi:hypothetical protein